MTLQEKAYTSEHYKAMWYQNSWTVGIRKKFDECNQIWSFGGKKSPLSQEAMEELGEECLKKLDAGMPEADVHQWAKDMAR